LAAGMICVWLISVWQFAFSVELSDACDDPQSAIEQSARTAYAKQLQENVTLQIVEYYIYCDEAHAHNPLQEYSNEAYDTLVGINQTVYNLVNSSAAQKMGIVNETTQLYFDYTHSMTELYIVNTSLDCGVIHSYLTDITYDLCDSGVQYWLLLYCTQALIVCLLMIRFCCVCTHKSIDSEVNGDSRARAQQRLAEYLNEEDVHVKDNSMQLASYYDPMASPKPTFTDEDVRKCIRYLLPYASNREEMNKIVEQLKEKGYPGGDPLPSQLVGKATAVLRNYDATADSSYHHPLLDGIL
jgi:hypothetical protein